jgi:hypothetical protein
MPAELITRFKNITPDGGVIELVVWRVPTPVPPTEHGFKYRAVYAKDGIRIVGFDNERGNPSSTANPDFSRFRLSGFNKIKHLQLMF